jgi:hypothetical protein
MNIKLFVSAFFERPVAAVSNPERAFPFQSLRSRTWFEAGQNLGGIGGFMPKKKKKNMSENRQNRTKQQFLSVFLTYKSKMGSKTILLYPLSHKA